MTSAPNTPGLPAPTYAVGDVLFDKYRLVSLLGQGGMGDVWLAHNETLDVDVAVKVIRSGLGAAGLGERLLVEARAAAKLGHPAIVRVFDFGTTARGDPFLVMELLQGEDLGTALGRRGRLNAVRGVQMLLPIAHALHTAHAKGIVHRDIKPDNIFLVDMGGGNVQPKLVDFGIAKLGQPTNQRLTALGSLVGTPAYMSPEQARGEEVDHRADIWAFTLVLYEAITATLPFDCENYHATLRAIIEDAPPPTPALGAGDAQLWAILERGLAKRVDSRISSMRELGTALAQWLLWNDVNEDASGASLQAMWLQEDAPVTRNKWASDAPRSLRTGSGATPNPLAAHQLATLAGVTPTPTPASVRGAVVPEDATPRRPRRTLVPWALGLALALAVGGAALRFTHGREGAVVPAATYPASSSETAAVASAPAPSAPTSAVPAPPSASATARTPVPPAAPPRPGGVPAPPPPRTKMKDPFQ